jgi:hypothetical protein
MLRHFSLINTTANSKIVLVLNEMVLVLLLLLGSPTGFEYEYEYEYHFIEYEYDNAIIPDFGQHLVVVIGETCRK